MPRPRFTIARLMVVELFLALGLGALRNISQKNAEETGTLTPRIDWYVTDDRASSHYKPVSKQMGTVIKEARRDGIRPMTVQRLRAFLGYGMGQAEAVRH